MREMRKVTAVAAEKIYGEGEYRPSQRRRCGEGKGRRRRKGKTQKSKEVNHNLNLQSAGLLRGPGPSRVHASSDSSPEASEPSRRLFRPCLLDPLRFRCARAHAD